MLIFIQLHFYIPSCLISAKMKSILLSVGAFILLLLSSCASQKDFVIESDYSYLGRFNKYKTFGFVSIEKRDSSSHNKELERWIIGRLESQGYTYTEKKPDMYVNYKIYFTDLKYRGYNQEELDAYLNKEISLTSNYQEDELMLSEEEIEEMDKAAAATRQKEYDTRYYNMDSGTLLIILVDRRKHSAVWQGYASGVFAYGADNLDRQLRRAAGVIFDKYKVVASGYLISD